MLDVKNAIAFMEVDVACAESWILLAIRLGSPPGVGCERLDNFADVSRLSNRSRLWLLGTR
jgi:hypothetical protein